MGALIDLIEAGEKLINEHASAAALAQHLAFVKAQADAFEKENIELKREVADLKDVVGHLTRELKAKASSDEFVEHRGVLFKRKTEGGYHKVPYCPICKTAMSSMEGILPYSCKCHFHADFNGSQLAEIMSELS